MEPLSANDPRVVGEFALRARLGSGGMGRVYLGFSPGGRAVAIKVVHPELARDPEFLRRFRQEVASARLVSGMYTAAVVGSGVDDDPPWLATAYVPGPPLADVVNLRGPLAEAAVWRLAAGLADALRAVHGCGLVHRDLKPGNVLLAADGPHVIDFGISRAFEGTALTSAGMVVGTPGYMSPEQAEGQQAGPPSDVFSLGCVLAYAATGNAPFGGGSAASILYRVVTAEPDLGGIPAGLGQVITACLSKDPAKRIGLAQLTAMISALGPPLPGTIGAFWPEPLAGIIAADQAPHPPTEVSVPPVSPARRAAPSWPARRRPTRAWRRRPHPAGTDAGRYRARADGGRRVLCRRRGQHRRRRRVARPRAGRRTRSPPSPRPGSRGRRSPRPARSSTLPASVRPDGSSRPVAASGRVAADQRGLPAGSYAATAGAPGVAVRNPVVAAARRARGRADAPARDAAGDVLAAAAAVFRRFLARRRPAERIGRRQLPQRRNAAGPVRAGAAAPDQGRAAVAGARCGPADVPGRGRHRAQRDLRQPRQGPLQRRGGRLYEPGSQLHDPRRRAPGHHRGQALPARSPSPPPKRPSTPAPWRATSASSSGSSASSASCAGW